MLLPATDPLKVTFALQFKIEPFKHPLKADPAYRGEAKNYVLVNIGSDISVMC